jgi:hypothetical protein
MSRLPHFVDSRLIDDGEVVSLMPQPPFAPPPPKGGSWYSFLLRGGVDPRVIVWLEGLGQLTNPVTSSGLEPATFQLVAQCVNQLCYCMPLKKIGRSSLFSSYRVLLISFIHLSFQTWHKCSSAACGRNSEGYEGLIVCFFTREW